MTIDNPEMLQFTHLLMEAKSKYSPKIRSYLKTHNIIDSIDAFSHIAFNYNMLPPIKVKTKPSIFIMKRKSNIKYDPHKTISSVNNFPKQIDNIEDVEFNMSDEVKTAEPVHMESLGKFKNPENTSEQNLLDNKEIQKIINNSEENVKIFNNLVNDNATSMKNTITRKIEDTNKLSSISREKLIRKEKNVNSQEYLESVPIYDAKLDEKTKIEEEKIIEEEAKNDLNLHQENHSTKKTIRKIIQEKIREDKQKQEINAEPKNIELPINLMKKAAIVTDFSKRRILKQEAKDIRISTVNESTLTDQNQIKIVKEDDDKQKFMKTKDTTEKVDNIKIKPINLKQIVENEDLSKENEDVNTEKIIDVKKITKTQNSVDTELPVTERQIVDKERKTDIKSSKSINVRESIKNIINLIKEFEKHFIYDNIDSMNDTSHANYIESDLHITKKDNSMDHSAKSKDQTVVKDARESFKEILDQFKYIKDELTSEEDDLFDEIAAKYMEQSIAETLLQFSEALKTLMQRRKKTLSDLYDNQNANVTDMRR